MERREFFQSLITGGATVRRGYLGANMKHRSDPGERLYLGPMEIPETIAKAVAEDPKLFRTRGGGKNKVAMRYAAAGWTWLFRSAVPEHRGMIGDIIRCADGHMRVCCWSVADPGEYRTPQQIADRHDDIPDVSLPHVSANPELPPIAPWHHELMAEPTSEPEGV